MCASPKIKREEGEQEIIKLHFSLKPKPCDSTQSSGRVLVKKLWSASAAMNKMIL